MSARARSAWLIWGLGAAFYGYGFFQRVAPSVMADDLMRDFALGGALLGSLAAAYFYAYAAVQIPVGILLDRFGPRWLLIGGSALAAAGSLLFALAGSYLGALLGRALIGAGVGFGFISALKLASSWFPPERFARMAGLTLAAGIAGGIFAQAPLAAAVDAFGWRATMVGGALVALALGLAIAAVVRSPPEDGSADPAPAQPEARGSGGLAIVRGAELWLLTIYAGCTGAPILVLAGLWLVPYLTQVQGLARAEAGVVASLLLGAWAIGSPLAGWLSERIGQGWAMIIGAAALTASFLPFSVVPGLPLIAVLVLSVAIGLAGGFMILAFAYARHRYGSEQAGTATGVVNSSVLLIGAALQSLIGWLLDLQWTGLQAEGARIYTEAAYRWAFLTLCLATGLALLSGMLLKLREPSRAG